MKISKLNLENFKNFEKFETKFNDRNLILAPNGSGKSNLIEAIYILSTGKAARAENEGDIVNWNFSPPKGINPYARINGLINNSKQTNLSYYLEQNHRVRKELRINDKKHTTAIFIQQFQTILFDPESLDIINRSPSVRRRFIDRFLAGYDKEYLLDLARYNKTITNRNKLLSYIKERRANPTELVYWDINLAETGVKVIQKRRELFNQLSKNLPTSQKKVMKEKFDLNIDYLSNIYIDNLDDDNLILAKFTHAIEDAKERDLAIGQTTIGPHRDDFKLSINSKNTRNYASRGQQRIAIVALLFALSDIVYDNIGMHPTLLLDDVLSELDIEHSQNVLQALKEIPNQVIISATDTAKVGNKLLDHYDRIELELQ